MSQFALPLSQGPGREPARIVVGNANEAAVEALSSPSGWPFRTAILSGPPRSGRSLLARWFAAQGGREVVDDADTLDETDLFHRWNRAQESGDALLLVTGAERWNIALPDLRSRIGAALPLQIGVPDDAMVAALIESHAEQAGLALGEGALTYLVPRVTRSFAGIETLVAEIDRLSLERKSAATMSLWREALEAVSDAEAGAERQPRLI